MPVDAVQEVTRTEYTIFIFFASLGVLQLGALGGQLKGMLFFRRPALTYLFALLTTGAAFFWFFFYESRIDTIMRQTGLEGKQQFAYFCLGAFLAVVATLLLTSLLAPLRRKAGCARRNPGEGLESLTELSYYEAVKRSLKTWWNPYDLAD